MLLQLCGDQDGLESYTVWTASLKSFSHGPELHTQELTRPHINFQLRAVLSKGCFTENFPEQLSTEGCHHKALLLTLSHFVLHSIRN